MSLGQPLGTAMILGLAPAIVNNDVSNVNLLNLVMFGVTVACAILTIFVKNKPLTPPSRSAETTSMPFREGLRSLASNKWYWLIWIVFGLLVGAFNVYVTLISDYVTPQGYSESDAGNLGLTSIAVGIVSAAIVGPILDRTRSHRTVFRLLPVFGGLGVILFFLGAGWSNRLALLFAGAAMIGCSGFPVMPLSLELGVECTYPVAEGISSGLLWTSGQFWGIIGLLVSNALRGSDASMRSSLGVLMAMVGIPIILAPFYNATSRRMALEAQEKAEEVNIENNGVVASDGGENVSRDEEAVECGKRK
ncbi:hypothetical protein HDU67_001651 [Dinochytrium kinnereticum]|nr:hypothetical protein HDU67_001651 [Dinochytrium kinnereticum]